MRSKSDMFNWHNARWKEFMIYNWYAEHVYGFILRKHQLKRVLNFGGHLGRAIDRVWQYYDLLLTLIPEQSNLLRHVREILIGMLELAETMDAGSIAISSTVLSRRFKNKEEIRASIDRFQRFMK